MNPAFHALQNRPAIFLLFHMHSSKAKIFRDISSLFFIYSIKQPYQTGAALKQTYKKHFRIRLLWLLFLCLFLSACQPPSKSHSSSSFQTEQRSFDSYTDKLFIQEMQKNTINLHYTLARPEDFGIKSHKISLGNLSRKTAEASMASIENMNRTLLTFDRGALNSRQQLTLDILKDHCKKELSAASFYYYNEPLRPTTGIHSELPVLLAEYAFEDSCDVTDYLALLTCVEDYFEQICQFEQEKASAGLFMSDFAADAVIDACRKFSENPKENYLIDTFNARIDGVSDISEEKKSLYKRENLSFVENSLIPSYEKLADTLVSLKGSGKNDAGLCHLPQGKEYYEYLVGINTGSSKRIEQLQKETERQRGFDMAMLHKILASRPELASSGEPYISLKEPTAILEHLKTAMQTDFYPAANSSYELNYVHTSLEDTLAPAFYLTAPIDDISRNVIYLNKGSQYNGIQLFTTLAHEGFPGHLYQTTGSCQAGLSPIRALLGFPGYVEGWATYVEMLSYRYAGLDETLADMLMYNQSALLSLYASIDMGIHYDGWSYSDMTSFLNGYGITDSGAARSIYELIVEEPSHYLKYYIGYLEFLDLKDYAKETLGEAYSDRDFHQAIIRIGPAPFSILRQYLRTFYTSS